MASYPTSPKAFTTKNTGDVIQAAHVNDLQDEVTAIETGLLTGTANFHSSNSSVANLNVTGKSTFVNGIVVGGMSTFLLRPQMPSEMAQVFLDAAQDFGSSAASTVLFKSQNFLYNAAMHSTASAGLYPFSTGMHRFSGQLLIQGVVTSSQYVQLDIIDSSGAQIGIERRDVNSTLVQSLSLRVEGFKYVNNLDGLGAGLSTQYCSLRFVTAGGGSTARANGAAGSLLTYFTMTKI